VCRFEHVELERFFQKIAPNIILNNIASRLVNGQSNTALGTI
jgi:hypothetical protein